MSDIASRIDAISDAFAQLSAVELEHWTQVRDLCAGAQVMWEDFASMFASLAAQLDELPVHKAIPNEFDEMTSQARGTAYDWIGDLRVDFDLLHAETIELSEKDHSGVGFWCAE
jgi:hypothetical protein